MIIQKSVKKNVFYNMLLKILNIIFPIITFTYVASILSPEGIGKVDIFNVSDTMFYSDFSSNFDKVMRVSLLEICL